MAKYLAIMEAIVTTILQNLQKIIVKSDSSLMVNFIHDKISVYKKIINLVKDMRMLDSLNILL